MRRLWKWFRNRHGGFDYRYIGDLPANYPIPGTEFYYNGERGWISFYCVYIHRNGENATLRPVVIYKGRDDLIYNLRELFPDLQVDMQV